MYKFVNPNPKSNIVGDCTVRAVALACGLSWDEAYTGLCDMGFYLKDMPNANRVWGAFLKNMGFVKSTIPNTCPDCYTIGDFADDHPHGVYVLGTGTHTVAVIDGTIMDSWDSSDEVPVFYWQEVNL